MLKQGLTYQIMNYTPLPKGKNKKVIGSMKGKLNAKIIKNILD